MSARWSRRIAVLLSLGLVAGLTVGAPRVLHPEPVAADWTDQENATAAVTAATLQPPTNLTCTMNPGLLGKIDSVTLTWKTTMPAPASFKVGIAAGANGQPANMTEITGATPSLVGGTQDTYTVTITIDLLTGLLSGLLGSTSTFGIANTAGNNWVSASRARAELSIPLLGLLVGSTCKPI